MAETPADRGDDSKLELPRLGIFRRPRKKAPGDDDAADETPTEIPGTPASVAPGDTDESPDDPPAEAAVPLAELGSESDEPDLEETVAEPVAEETAGVAEAAPEPQTDLHADQTQAIQPVEDDHVAPAATGRKPRGPKPRKELSMPALDTRIAALVTGVVVGLVGVALTVIGQRGCEAVKGTGSCGGVGLFLLIAILALMVLLGATLLKAWNISDPTSSSLLAVGLVAVLAMLFFLPFIDRWYMVIVVPLLTALTYLLSWWVTHTFAESAQD